MVFGYDAAVRINIRIRFLTHHDLFLYFSFIFFNTAKPLGSDAALKWHWGTGYLSLFLLHDGSHLKWELFLLERKISRLLSKHTHSKEICSNGLIYTNLPKSTTTTSGGIALVNSHWTRTSKKWNGEVEGTRVN